MVVFVGKAHSKKQQTKQTFKKNKTPSDEHKLYKELADILESVCAKKTLKSVKSEKIDLFIKNFLHTRNNFYLKRDFTRTMKFCIKYGSESQRDKLQEFFKENLEQFLISTVVGCIIKAFFYYGSTKRKREFIELLGSKIPKLVVSKNAGNVLEDVFKECLQPSQKYEFIENYFGQPFKIFKVSYPKKTWNEFAKEKEFDLTLQVVAENIKLFIAKEAYGSGIFHYLLLKLIQLDKEKFGNKIVPLFSDLFFEQPDILKTHYSCLLVSLMLLYHNNTNFSFTLDNNAVEKLNLVIKDNLDWLFSHSGGCILAFVLCHFEQYKEEVHNKLLEPFSTNTSYYIGNEPGYYNNFLNFLELLSFTDLRKSSNYSLLKIIQDSDFKLEHFYDFKNVKDILASHRDTVLSVLKNHFSKNSHLILVDLGYGHLFSHWRYLLPSKVVKVIYLEIQKQLTSKATDKLNSWQDSNNVSKVVLSIMNSERRSVDEGHIKEEDTFQYLLGSGISFKDKVAWLSTKVGYRLILSFLKYCKDEDTKSKLSIELEKRKAKINKN